MQDILNDVINKKLVDTNCTQKLVKLNQSLNDQWALKGIIIKYKNNV